MCVRVCVGIGGKNQTDSEHKRIKQLVKRCRETEEDDCHSDEDEKEERRGEDDAENEADDDNDGDGDDDDVPSFVHPNL